MIVVRTRSTYEPGRSLYQDFELLTRAVWKALVEPIHGFNSDLTGTALEHEWSLMSVTETQQYTFKKHG